MIVDLKRRSFAYLLAGVVMLVAGLATVLLVVDDSQAATPGLEYGQIAVDNPDGGTVATSSSPGSRIVGGSDTTFEKYPWQVQITGNGQPLCGGMLIHPMIVMTAAHCLVDENLNFLPVTFALFTGRTQSGTGGEQLTLSGGAGVANNYVPSTHDNDYGFIALSSPSSRPRIQIAGADERGLWRAGRAAIVTGYGAIAEGGSQSPVLKHLAVPILDDSTCQGAGSYGAAFHSSVMLCAGYMSGGEDSCQGDSGGPLVAPADGGIYRLVGVVSWGVGCARPNLPGIYTRIAEPSLTQIIASYVQNIEQIENFPGQNNGISVVGSGAKPPGCSAANSAAAAQQSKYNKANKAAAKARKALKKQQKKLRRAKGKARKRLKRAVNKARTRANKGTRKAKSAKKAAQKAKAAASAACN